MDLRRIIISDYQERVALTELPEDFKRSLRTHERVPRFIDNLCKDLVRVKELDRATIKMCVYDLTDLFIKMAKKHADEKLMTELAKRHVKAEHDAKMAKRREYEEFYEQNFPKVETFKEKESGKEKSSQKNITQ